MDVNVYSKPNVGNFLNENFISVRVQKDTTLADGSDIKLLYQTANELERTYKIKVLPSFLFFDSNGKIVHRGAGSASDSEFLKLAKNSLVPDKQYYSLLQSYNSGKRNYEEMTYLARKARSIGDDDIANVISKEYIESYLLNLSHDYLFSKENIDFLYQFTNSSKDKGFQLLLQYANKIDSVMGVKKFYSIDKLDLIIIKEEIDSNFNTNQISSQDEPKWRKIGFSIDRKYGREFSKRIVANVKLRWYKDRKDWDNLIREYIKKNGNFTNGVSADELTSVNNFAFDVIFRYATKKRHIGKAVGWMKQVLEKTPTTGLDVVARMDTYACLLYKLGKIDTAIYYESKVVQICKDANEVKYAQYFEHILARMKNREKIWLFD